MAVRGAGAIPKIPVDFSGQSDSLLPYAASDLPAVNGLKAELSPLFWLFRDFSGSFFDRLCKS